MVPENSSEVIVPALTMRTKSKPRERWEPKRFFLSPMAWKKWKNSSMPFAKCPSASPCHRRNPTAKSHYADRGNVSPAPEENHAEGQKPPGTNPVADGNSLGEPIAQPGPEEIKQSRAPPK